MGSVSGHRLLPASLRQSPNVPPDLEAQGEVGGRDVTPSESGTMGAGGPTALSAGAGDVSRFELLQRLLAFVSTTPSLEISYVEACLNSGSFEELSAEWCRRLGLPVLPANKLKVMRIETQIYGPDGEPMVELDRVKFDGDLQGWAPGGDVWLEVALVHPSNAPGDCRCSISTRFALTDREVAAKIAAVQDGWVERFGVRFLKRGEAKPYLFDPIRGTYKRLSGRRSLYPAVTEARRVYRYLFAIAQAWDELGPGVDVTASRVKQSILDGKPKFARDLFADTGPGSNRPSGDLRPNLTRELVERVGRALGFVDELGRRKTRSKDPAIRRVDIRLLRLVARILAPSMKKPADNLLRNVVRPALVGDAFTGYIVYLAEKDVRPRSRRGSAKQVRSER